MVDRLDSLRHHAVVGGNDEHHDVGDAGPPRAHRREGLVAGGVDEGQQLTAPLHLVSADVLGDPTGLACDHVRMTDPVEKQRLAVVDVAHDGDDGRSYLQVLVLVLKFLAAEELGPECSLLLLTWVDQPDLRADLRGEQADHVVGERLGRGDHLALEQEETHDVASGPIEARAELLGRGTPLHDHLVVGNRSTRRQVSRYLDRLELLHVAAATAGPPLGRTSAPDRTTTCGTRRTTGGIAPTTARAWGSPTSVGAAGRASAVSGREVTRRAREAGARSGPWAHLPAGRWPRTDRAWT